MTSNRANLTKEQLKADRDWFDSCKSRYYAQMSTAQARGILSSISSKEKKKEFIDKINNAKKLYLFDY